MTTAQDILTALNNDFTKTLESAAKSGMKLIETEPELTQAIGEVLGKMTNGDADDTIYLFAKVALPKLMEIIGNAHDAMVIFGAAAIICEYMHSEDIAA